MTRTIRSSYVVVWLCLIMLVMGLSVAAAQESPAEQPDLNTVIARVNDEEITADAFVKRLRFERLRYYLLFEQLVVDEGLDVLQVNDPANQYAMPILQVTGMLMNDEQFADRIYNLMLMEALYHQEAVARGIEVDQCDLDEIWSQVLNVDSPQECPAEANFDALRGVFLEKARTYAGMSPDEVARIIVSRAEYEQVFTALGEDLQVEELPAVRSRHIRVPSEDTASEILTRLQAGEAFEDLLVEFTTDPNPTGTGGDLGSISPGQVDATFETAAFSADIGEIVGPVQTPFGYHVLQVTDRVMQVRARHILFEDESSAQTAIRLLNNGADFAELARLYSIDTGSGMRGGDLGFFGPGRMVPEFEQAVFSAELNEIVGPVQSQFGYHVIEVTEIGDVPAAVTVRHILLETPEDAQSAIARLDAGEDFAALARELSIDGSAAGHQGDTLSVFSFGSQRGLYTRGEIAADLEDAVFAAEPGDLLGPLPSRSSYYVIEVQEQGTRLPSAAEIEILRDDYAFQWQTEQFNSDRVQTGNLWRRFVTLDPLPSVYNPVLEPLDALFRDARQDFLMLQEANNLLNTLRRLQAPSTSQE